MTVETQRVMSFPSESLVGGKSPITELWRTQTLKLSLEEKLEKKDFLNRKEDCQDRVMIQKGREKNTFKIK